MAKKPLRDIVIVLPGITGSVLQKDGRDLWALSSQAMFRAIGSLGDSLQEMRLDGDDPKITDLGDGIRATRLMPDAHIVPGLEKIDGYSHLLKSIKDNFKVSPGDASSAQPGNFFEFPYDWRRDNRFAAGELKKLVDLHLPLWRKSSGADDAKVILVAHSMGGLVARHYLEVLKGWRDCRALVSFGTPYRGSLNALDYLANGYKRWFMDLTEVMRTFTSIYQLMPIYEAVKIGGKFRRVAECDGIPNVSAPRARQALVFHRDIEESVKAHEQASPYQNNGYKIMPFVGIRQPTSQSAALVNGRLRVSRTLPDVVEALLDGGDGMVPRASAIPIEYSNEHRGSFCSERHGSLQRNAAVLDDLLGRIEQMQAVNAGGARFAGPEIPTPSRKPSIKSRPAIALDLQDLYFTGEPIELRADIRDGSAAGAISVTIAPVGKGQKSLHRMSRQKDGHWALKLDELVPGAYRIEVGAAATGPRSPAPVHDIFAVTTR